jgi:hypothetical protein
MSTAVMPYIENQPRTVSIAAADGATSALTSALLRCCPYWAEDGVLIARSFSSRNSVFDCATATTTWMSSASATTDSDMSFQPLRSICRAICCGSAAAAALSTAANIVVDATEIAF